MTVDEALADADYGQKVGFYVAPHYVLILAAEVRRLRAMLEPTPDAREPVRWFAAQMERKLKEHDQDRGVRGWIGPTCYPAYLMERLMEEAEEYRDTPSNDIQAKIDELADIANFAMMLADRLRAAIKGAAHE